DVPSPRSEITFPMWRVPEHMQASQRESMAASAVASLIRGLLRCRCALSLVNLDQWELPARSCAADTPLERGNPLAPRQRILTRLDTCTGSASCRATATSTTARFTVTIATGWGYQGFELRKKGAAPRMSVGSL
ncbi:hypothetical protein KUCAC02_018699, partial [Chaenocephalus aceratus]